MSCLRHGSESFTPSFVLLLHGWSVNSIHDPHGPSRLLWPGIHKLKTLFHLSIHITSHLVISCPRGMIPRGLNLCKLLSSLQICPVVGPVARHQDVCPGSSSSSPGLGSGSGGGSGAWTTSLPISKYSMGMSTTSPLSSSTVAVSPLSILASPGSS